VPLIGPSTAARIEVIPPGQSDVVELVDGQAVLATVSEFHAEGQSSRLIALQRIASDLERVQLRAWRDVMSTLSHEMMNSLTPIASLAETLHDRMQRMPVDSEAAAIDAPAIEAIARRSRGLLEFVQRYREVAELPEPRIVTIEASEFALRMERLIAPAAAKRNILFECRLDATAQRLALDPVLTEQAVVNLLFNALDAAEGINGAMVALHVRVTQGDIELAVIDNGTGVDPSNRTQLFVPFFTTKAQGSGIGLNLARNIALVHGGRLTYEPNVPRGSVFTLVFPRSD
jgi:signal transduction histidine kinase